MKKRKASKSRSPVLKVMTVGLAEAADLIGKSETHVLSLVKAGFIPRAGRGMYRPTDVARGALAFRDAEDRRSSQTEETKRLQAARARAVEMRNARLENELIPIEDVAITVEEIFTALSNEMRGFPAGATRDLAVRAEIQTALDGAFDRCRASIEKLGGNLAAGKGIVFDDNDGD